MLRRWMSCLCEGQSSCNQSPATCQRLLIFALPNDISFLWKYCREISCLTTSSPRDTNQSITSGDHIPCSLMFRFALQIVLGSLFYFIGQIFNKPNLYSYIICQLIFLKKGSFGIYIFLLYMLWFKFFLGFKFFKPV